MVLDTTNTYTTMCRMWAVQTLFREENIYYLWIAVLPFSS